MGVRYRYIIGLGHQLINDNGKVISTHDTRDEAEAAKDALPTKEADHPYWSGDKK